VGTYLLKVRRAGVRWVVIDAEGCVLGRLAARASRVLMGKDAPDYTPHIDHRGGVIIINAEKVRLTGGSRRFPRGAFFKPGQSGCCAMPLSACYPRAVWVSGSPGG